MRHKQGEIAKRSVGRLMLLALVYCCVSGGPYGLEPLVAQSGAGLAVLLIVVTPIIWSLPDALTTAELASAIPAEGGYVVWVKRALGPFAGFLNAWWTWMYALVDASIYPVLFAGYLGSMMRILGWDFLDYPGWSWAASALVIVALVTLNVRGARNVGLASTAFAAMLILPFLALVVVALVRYIGQGGAPALSFVPDGKSALSATGAGLAVVMWNYLGWDNLSTIAEEVDRPEKAYPFAMLAGVPLVTVVYLLPVLAGLLFVPDISRWTEDSWPYIARQIGGAPLFWLISVGALVSACALFASSVLATSRVPYVLARDGFMPQYLMEVHPKFGTPWKAVLLCGLVYALMALRSFQQLVTLNVVMFASALILQIVSLIVLRVREPELARPFRVPGGFATLIPMLAFPVALTVFLVASTIAEEGWPAQAPTAVVLLSGPVVYVAAKLARGRRMRG